MPKPNTETSPAQISAMIAELENALTAQHKPHLFWKHWGNFCFVLLMLVLLLLGGNVLLDKRRGEIPNVFGYQIFQVETGSMIPTFPVGTLILGHAPKDESDLAVDDIITFRYEEQIITHRIVDIVQNETGQRVYRTKGDNPNNSLDPWYIYFWQIEAKYTCTLPLPR